MHFLPSRQGLDGRPPLPTAVDATGVLRHSLNVLEKDMIGPLATLFQRVTQGVYVVGVAHGEVRNAFTAAWVMQVSFEPLLLALSINPQHSSYGLLKGGGAFSVNVLKKGQLLDSEAESMSYRQTGDMDGALALFPDVFDDG